MEVEYGAFHVKVNYPFFKFALDFDKIHNNRIM